MTTLPTLSQSQISAALEFAGLGDDGLRAVTQAVAGAAWLSSEDFERLALEQFEDQESAVAVTRTVLLTHTMAAARETTISTAVKELYEVLRRDSSNPLEAAEWNPKGEFLQAMAGSESVRLLAKSLELSYDYANLYRSAKVITDIRPIFNSDTSAISGAIVSYTLRVRYYSADVEHEISIAMDTSDINDLGKQCDRGLQKARIAHAHMKNATTGVHSEISGGKP